MKIHTLTAGMLCLATVTTGACVTRSTYDTAVADREAVKAELDDTRFQSQALTEQVSELELRKTDLARQMEAASSGLQRATQQMKAEHVALQERLSRLNRIISQLIAQRNRLQYALQRVNEERPSLESIVEEYKSKLSEADGPRAPLSSPPIEGTKQQAETALVPPAHVATQTDPALNPTVTAPAASADSNAADSKPSPASKQTSEPAEEDWLSMLKGWAMSIWRSIFP
jgi:predicted  nucleic acid-binding Zn-ribbon protein